MRRFAGGLDVELAHVLGVTFLIALGTPLGRTAGSSVTISLAYGAVDLRALANVIIVVLVVCSAMPSEALPTLGVSDATFHTLLIHLAVLQMLS